MKAILIRFNQKKDMGNRSRKEIICKHCLKKVKEKEIMVVAGYDICPYCNCEVK